MSDHHIRDVIKLFAETLYPMARPPEIDVLVIYDGDYFNDWDYEILGPRVRKFMRQTLESAGYRVEGSRYFLDPGGSWRFFIPKPMATLGGDIVSNLNAQNQSEFGTMILNPTEGLLMLLSLEQYQGIPLQADDLLNFVRSHPVNIAKIVKMKVKTPNYKIFLTAKDDILRAQHEGIQKRKFSRVKISISNS